MNKKSFKDIWFYANASFFINYSLILLRLFVAFPIPCLPSFFNSLFLLVAYSLTFQGLVTNYKSYNINTLVTKVITHPNTFCILLFLCFVPNILLSPFYLLCIYHIVSYIIAKKEAFHSYFFYNSVVFLNTNITTIGRSALFLEIFLIPITFILLLRGKIGAISLIAYFLMIRQQYTSNNNMKAVVLECLQYAHNIAMNLPDGVKMRYFEVSNLIRGYLKIDKEAEKKE